MTDIGVKITGLEDLQRAVRRYGRETRKSARDVVTVGWIAFCQSARARSPQPRSRFGRSTKTKREVIDNPNLKGVRNLSREDTEFGARYWIEVLHQNKKPTYIPTNSKRDKRRKIKTAGLLADSWMWLLRGSGKTGRTRNRRQRGTVSVTNRLSDMNPSVTLTNRLNYAAKVAPYLANEAGAAAARRMEGRLDKNVIDLARRFN